MHARIGCVNPNQGSAADQAAPAVGRQYRLPL